MESIGENLGRARMQASQPGKALNFIVYDHQNGKLRPKQRWKNERL